MQSASGSTHGIMMCDLFWCFVGCDGWCKGWCEFHEALQLNVDRAAYCKNRICGGVDPMTGIQGSGALFFT